MFPGFILPLGMWLCPQLGCPEASCPHLSNLCVFACLSLLPASGILGARDWVIPSFLSAGGLPGLYRPPPSVCKISNWWMQGSDRGRLRVQGHPPLSACVLPVTDGLPELSQACLWPADSTSPESSALCVLIGISLAGCPKPSDQHGVSHPTPTLHTFSGVLTHPWIPGHTSSPDLSLGPSRWPQPHTTFQTCMPLFIRLFVSP